MSLLALFGLASLAVLAVLTAVFLFALSAGAGEDNADEETIDDALHLHGVHVC